jgi:shikimate 5-dehydrogenase
MYFFGVTTGQSSSRKMFPAWMEILGLQPAQLVGVDLPIDAPAEQYRRAVEQIKDDPLSRGALVTTHKLNVLRAAADLFDELTADAELCQEVSCIYKRDGRLIGHAVDPTTSGQSMRAFLPPGYWTDHRPDVLCLGAGGSAVALVTYFATQAAPVERPHRFILVNRSRPKLDNISHLLGRLPPTDIRFELVCNSDPAVNDRLMATLPPHSMVINATGMGKDIPGSPITADGRFPEAGVAWAQAAARRLQVEDGWDYFLLGWAEIVGRVFDVAIDQPAFARLAAAAESVRAGVG